MYKLNGTSCNAFREYDGAFDGLSDGYVLGCCDDVGVMDGEDDGVVDGTLEGMSDGKDDGDFDGALQNVRFELLQFLLLT